ncbi:AAA family ATPase [Xylophilus sp. Kf1]|nr:AAA family ATPase [Xylophilus sp. Kf1]
MRIDSINIKNFRCFEALHVRFDPKITVIVAPNGQGKSSLLDAIKVALWPFVAGFDLGSSTNDSTGIHIDDVRRAQVRPHQMEWRLPSEVSARGFIRLPGIIEEGLLDPGPRDWPEPELQRPWEVRRTREKIKKGTKTKDGFVIGIYDEDHSTKVHTAKSYETSLKGFAQNLQRRTFTEREGGLDELPMLGVYGTGRLWSQRKLHATHEVFSAESQSRTYAYRDCLDPASSFKHFVTWFKRVFLTLRDAQIGIIERNQDGSNIDASITAPVRAIQQAINHVLQDQTGWHRLEFSAEYEELILEHPRHGKLKVSQLSDGIRNTLALVGDIAYRCYKLNAHWGADACLRTHGVVLIDEVDMHLHPQWQQTILIDLARAFPELQFIVTTHSPQVLTSVDAQSIRKLVSVENEGADSTGRQKLTVESAGQQTRGVASADALAVVMDVNPIPDVREAQWLEAYHALIQQDLHDSAEGLELRDRLNNHFGIEHPVMLECGRMIRLQVFKRRLPSRATNDRRSG